MFSFGKSSRKTNKSNRRSKKKQVEAIEEHEEQLTGENNVSLTKQDKIFNDLIDKRKENIKQWKKNGNMENLNN